MDDNSKVAGRVSAPDVSVRPFAATAEAAIADLEERVPAGMGPLERALAERIRTALARLLECSEQLAADGLMIVGSTGQPRPHQLLKTEQELRRESSEGLQTLTFRAEQGDARADAGGNSEDARWRAACVVGRDGAAGARSSSG